MILDFPRTKFVDVNGADQQLEHLLSEYDEIESAYFNENNEERVAEETFDLIQSAITLLYILQEDSGVDLARIKEQVLQKNRARGYYSE